MNGKRREGMQRGPGLLTNFCFLHFSVPLCLCGEEVSKLRLEPAEAGFGVARRPILAADPALVCDPVEEPEQERIVDLSGIRFVATRRPGDLHMADLRQILLDRRRQIAL